MVSDQELGAGLFGSSNAWEQPWAGSEEGSGRRGRWGLGSQDAWSCQRRREAVGCVLTTPPRCAPGHRLRSSLVFLVLSDGHRCEATQAAGISPRGRGVGRKGLTLARGSEPSSQQGQWPWVALPFFICKSGLLAPPKRLQ